MSTVTLDAIKAKQTEIAGMIAALEAQASISIAYHFPEAQIELRAGEHYAGIIVGKDGAPSHHLILLPGEAEGVTWKQAKEWADKQGAELVAELPTRREQALLYANLKEQFQGAWYWSCEQHAALSVSAWCQYFLNGSQYDYYTGIKLRARAVRRLIIE